MKKILIVSLLLLTSVGTISNHQPVNAKTVIIQDSEPEYYYHRRRRNRRRRKKRKDEVTVCRPITRESVRKNPGYHPEAYIDGYSQGERSAIKGEAYKPRTAGGEFGRGFYDGYFGRKFTGQKRVVPNKITSYKTTQCQTY